MDNNKFLNEKKYQNTKTIFIILAILLLIIGFVVGGLIIKKGLNKKNDIYSKYTEENKQAQIVSLNVQIKIAKSSLESKKAELIAQGLQPSSNYEDNESYNLYIINNVLNPSFNRCSFDEYKNNELTSQYCNLIKRLEDTEKLDIKYKRKSESFSCIPYYMVGTSIILFSIIISISLFLIAKRREIIAFQAQQAMPVVKEGIEEISPALGKAAKDVINNIKDDNK
ncbi:MAG TPA: hypothetical protein OIM63_00670 [Bacilli bacterium]|nr:hypothetical protein [Bacilli bacterium]